MTKEETYDFIGHLAIALYTSKIKINLTSLNTILRERDADYDSNRGLAAGVGAAYRHWKEKDPVVYHAIAYTYTNQNGDLSWM